MTRTTTGGLSNNADTVGEDWKQCVLQLRKLVAFMSKLRKVAPGKYPASTRPTAAFKLFYDVFVLRFPL